MAVWTDTGQDGNGQGVYARLFQTPVAPINTFSNVAINQLSASGEGAPITELVLA